MVWRGGIENASFVLHVGNWWELWAHTTCIGMGLGSRARSHPHTHAIKDLGPRMGTEGLMKKR